MQYLIDASLPRLLVAAILQLGHQVEFARDIGMAAAPEIAHRGFVAGLDVC